MLPHRLFLLEAVPLLSRLQHKATPSMGQRTARAAACFEGGNHGCPVGPAALGFCRNASEEESSLSCRQLLAGVASTAHVEEDELSCRQLLQGSEGLPWRFHVNATGPRD